MDVSDELWASEKWQRTTVEQHPWMRQNSDELAPDRDDRRWFVPQGCRWPLLCVTVYPTYSRRPLGVLVAVSYKSAPDGWFTDCNLPRALVPTLVEMLQRVT